MDQQNQEQHHGPGRRFATDSTQGDQLVGTFGFVSHGFFFTALGLGMGLCPYFEHDTRMILLWVLALSAAACLAVRTVQVGTTTTVESLKAIKKAWWQ